MTVVPCNKLLYHRRISLRMPSAWPVPGRMPLELLRKATPLFFEWDPSQLFSIIWNPTSQPLPFYNQYPERNNQSFPEQLGLPLGGEPTIPSMGPFLVEGATLKVTETLKFDLLSTPARVPGVWPVSGWVSFEIFGSSIISSFQRHFPPNTFDRAKWDSSLRKAADPTDYRPEGARWGYLNHSRFSTRRRSEVIDHSLESYDSPLQEKPTLPSVKASTAEREWI